MRRQVKLKTKNGFLLVGLICTISYCAYAEQTPNTVILKDGTTAKLDGNIELKNLASNQNINIYVKPQAWQIRRAKLTRTINALIKNPANASAIKGIDYILTAHSKNPGDYTPMEAMDILGVYYLPREGLRKIMPLIVEQAFLGWFDTLRWSSESGKAEIVNNERFFSRSFELGGGKKIIDEWVDMVKNNPEEAKKIIDTGLRYGILFNALKEKNRYDHHWPTGYGLERMMVAMGGKPVPLATEPKMEYVEAQKAAMEKITSTYLSIKK